MADDVDDFLASIEGAARPSSPVADPRVAKKAETLRSLLSQPDIPEWSKATIRKQLSAWGQPETSEPVARGTSDDVDAFISRALYRPPTPSPVPTAEQMISGPFGEPQAPSQEPNAPATPPQAPMAQPMDIRTQAIRGTIRETHQAQEARRQQDRDNAQTMQRVGGLADWWHSQGQAMSPREIADLGPEYVAEYERQSGLRPTIGPPPAEGLMTGGQLAQEVGEQFETGAYETAAPFSPNAPAAVQYRREAGPTGPIGAASMLAGSAVGFAANPAARAAGGIAERAALGPEVMQNIESAGRVVDSALAHLETIAKSQGVQGIEQTTGPQAEALKSLIFSARSFQAETARNMLGRVPAYMAEHMARPAAEGAFLGAQETGAGLAQGRIKPEEVPGRLIGTSLGFMVAAVGFERLSAFLKSLGIMPKTLVEKLRSGDDLTPQEVALIERAEAAARAAGIPTQQEAPTDVGPEGDIGQRVRAAQGALPPGPARPELAAEAGPSRVPMGPQPPQPRPDMRAELRDMKPWITDAEIDSTDDPGHLMQVATARKEAWIQNQLTQRATPEERAALAKPGAPRLLIFKAIEDRLAQRPPAAPAGAAQPAPRADVPAQAAAPAPEPIAQAPGPPQPAPPPEPHPPAPATPAPEAPVTHPDEEKNYQADSTTLKNFLSRGAPAVGIRKGTPESARSKARGSIAKGLGHWWEQVLVNGPLDVDEISELAGPEVAGAVARRFPGGTILRKGGQKIDEAADYLARQGFHAGDALGARNEILGMLEDLTRREKVGPPKAAGFGPPEEGIGELAKKTPAGELQEGDEVLTSDGHSWLVKVKGEKVILSREGKILTLDPFDLVPLVTRYGVSEKTPGYVTGAFDKAPPEVKRALLGVGGYHMRRGATDVAALTEKLKAEFGPEVEKYVPGLHAQLQKLPAFAPKKEVPGGPVRTRNAQQQPARAEGGVRLPAPERAGPQPRPGGGVHAPKPPAPAPQPAARPVPEAAPAPAGPAAISSPGIITVSRDLLPPHSPEDAALLRKLNSQEGLAEWRRKLGGRTPLGHQSDAFVRIRRAHLDGHAHILADGTGTGKTTVAGMVIVDAFDQKPDERALVVLRNPDLARQWTEDVLGPAGIKTHLYRGTFQFKPKTVNFITYATLERMWSSDQIGRLTEGFKPGLLIFDESHALKNYYQGQVSTAIAGEAIQKSAGRTLFLSATPFESALHTGYAASLKLWYPDKDWRSFLASAFDIYFDSRKGVWVGLSPKKFKAIHELLYTTNRMLKNEIDFGDIRNRNGEQITLTSENHFAPMSDEAVAESGRIDEFFGDLAGQVQTPTQVRLVRGLHYLVRRSLDESIKLPVAIEHAQRDLQQGRSVIFMLLRKNDTSMERWWQEYEEGTRQYKPWSKMPELIAKMRQAGIEIPGPVASLEKAFPGAVKITGDQPSGGAIRKGNIKQFQEGRARVAIVTMAAGAEGLNLQDRIGTFPRSMYVLSVPYNATQATQVAGRPFRVGSESSAESHWLFVDSPSDRRAASVLAETLRQQHAILRGEHQVPTADEIERFQFPELDSPPVGEVPSGYDVAEENLPGFEKPLSQKAMVEAKQREIARRGLKAKLEGMPEPGPLFGPKQPELPVPKEKTGVISEQHSHVAVTTRETGATIAIPNAEIRGPEDVAAIFDGLKTRPTEAMYVLYTKGKTPIAAEMIGLGLIDKSPVEFRYVYSAMRHLGADGAFAAHNHPSGSPTPSQDMDVPLTRDLANALAGWGMKLHGHVVVDIDEFGFINPDGTWTIMGLDKTLLGIRRAAVPLVEPSLARLSAVPSEPRVTDDAIAAAYYLTRLKDPKTTSTMIIATNNHRKVAASLTFDGGPEALLDTPEAAEAIRDMIANTMPYSLVAATNQPSLSPDADVALVQAVKTLIGPGVARDLLDDIVVADTSRVRSAKAAVYRSMTDAGAFVKERVPEYTVGEPDRIKARQAMIDEFMQALDTVSRTGRMGFLPRSVRAFYNPRTGVIRQRLHGDLENVVVEGGRRIYDILFRLGPGGLDGVGARRFRRFRSELSALTSMGPGIPRPLLEEGFSQFIRLYVKEPQTAKAACPEFYPWFEQHLQDTAPQIKDALDALRSDWADYRKADWRSRGHLTIQSGNTPLGRIKRGWSYDKLREYMLNRMAPVIRVTNDLLKLRGGGSINASEDARALSQLVNGRFALAQQMWSTGIGLFGKPVEKVSPAPRDLARAIGSDLKDYELYAKARRGFEEVRRGFDMQKDVGLDQDSAENAIKEIGPKHKGNFATANKIFHAILRWYKDAGFMTDKVFEETVKSHPDYSALYRLMDEEIQPRGGGTPAGLGTRATGLWQAIRRFKGSPRTTIPSLEAMEKMLFTIVDRGERNNLAVKLVQLGLSTVGGGRLIEEVPIEQWPTIVPVTKALDELRKLGITPRDVDIPESALEERIAFFQPTWMTPPRPYDWVWMNGRRRLFRFPEEVYDALRGQNKEPTNWLIKVLSAPARTLRSGAIAYVPPAWAWLAMKKLPADLIESQNALALAGRLIPAIFSMLRKDAEYDRFVRSGAAMAGFITGGRSETESLVARELAKAATPGKYWSNPVNVLREVIAFGRYLAFSLESAPRLAEAQGIWPKNAQTRGQLAGGAIAARNLGVDYSVQGSVAGLVNQWAAFYTAWLSGYRSAAIGLKKRPVKVGLGWLFTSALLTIAMWLHNRKQKQYQELSPHERAMYHHWCDDQALDSPLRIMPRTFVWGQADAALEAGLNWLDKSDPKAMDDFAEEFILGQRLGQETSVPWAIGRVPIIERALPIGALPLLENFANLNFRTGARVAPERGLPSEQAYPWTTETARRIGESLNYPPAKIEHLVQGWSGTAGISGMQAIDYLAGATPPAGHEAQNIPVIGRFLTQPGRATADSLTTVYGLWDDAERAYQSYRDKVKKNPQEATEFYHKHESQILRFYRMRGPVEALSRRRLPSGPTPDVSAEARKILESEAQHP